MKAKEHPLYGTWAAMLNRCYKKNAKKCYHHVEVYEPWRERFVPRRHGPAPGLLRFAAYVEEHLGSREGRSLDRIDPDGNYEPGNIRWVELAEQCRHRRVGWVHPPREDGQLPWAHRHKDGWLARFRFKAEEHKVGVFATMELAHEAAKQAREELLKLHQGETY